MTESSHHPTWTCLEGSIASEIVRAPKTGGDAQGTWPSVDWRNIGQGFGVYPFCIDKLPNSNCKASS